MLKLGSIDEFKSAVNSGGGFTKGNLFFVKFPTIKGINAYDLGLLCSQISLPSRQMSSVQRTLGNQTQEVVHGYAITPLSATFRVLNDQKVREYFESWQQFILPEYSEAENSFSARYPDQYTKPIHIYQLERGQSYPLFNKQFEKKLGPINLSFDLDIDIGNKAIANYHWSIDRAFPKSVTSTELQDGGDDITTITVEFEYKNWKGEKVENGKQKSSIFVNGKPL
ncbi:MAG TPA: hypothetical protein HA240_02285 [Candidatus Thalassarchaeaceae archaeon]|jgi:hypothetical protein|nr:MAG TPA: hypothetical protein D7I04_02280 [Candidatus Poseidoniales archaeon]HIH06060.1 hypothetical protein [Candidatus Thalassarchaeaceae archaeon]